MSFQYYCLSNGRYYYDSKVIDDVSDVKLLNEKDLQYIKENYENMYGQDDIPTNISYQTHDGIFLGSNSFNGPLEVDWRELLYRMAVDYSQAETQIKILNRAQAEGLQIIDKRELYRQYPLSRDSSLGDFLCGLKTTFNNIAYTSNTSYLCYIWDDEDKRFIPITHSVLDKVNEQRIKNSSAELKYWRDWVAQCGKTIFFKL